MADLDPLGIKNASAQLSKEDKVRRANESVTRKYNKFGNKINNTKKKKFQTKLINQKFGDAV